MRDSKKSKLRDYLTKNFLQAELPVGSITHIIDGGALLYSVKWIPDTTYRDIVKQYQSYLLSTFGLCTVIFDGFDDCPSTKDIKHHVRGSKTLQTVTVDLNKRVTVAQEKFLKNGRNQTMMISFLCDNLREHGFTTREAITYADTLIVKDAVKETKEKCSTVAVHADDIDAFCLCMHHCKDVPGEVFFQTFKKSEDNNRQIWSIRDVNEKVDDCVLDNILFLHPRTGCDTTFGTYGMGNESL